MVNNETKGSRAPRRFDSRRKGRFRVYAAACVPRAGSACCIPKGAISELYRTFHFSRSRPPLSTVLSADPFVNLSRGGKATPLVHWLSRLINRYAILNFPKNYPTIPSFVSDFPTHWFSIPCDFSDFLFFVEQSDVFNLYFSFPSFNFKNISWILRSRTELKV